MAKRFVIINEMVFDTDHLFIGEVKTCKGQITEINPNTGDTENSYIDGFGFEFCDSRDSISQEGRSLVYATREVAMDIRDGLVNELNQIISEKTEYLSEKLYV